MLLWISLCLYLGFPNQPGFDSWVGKIPWRQKSLPTPVFWPGEFHGLYSPWGRRESDTTEWLSLPLSFHVCILDSKCWVVDIHVLALLDNAPVVFSVWFPVAYRSFCSSIVSPTVDIIILLKHIWWVLQWHPTPVLLPGKSHGRRSLVGCSPWGR